MAQYFSNAERKELSTQNPTLSENILQMKGESRQSQMKKN